MAASSSKGSSSSGESKKTDSNQASYIDGVERGYVGEVHPEKNNDDYTVAGVAGSTGKASDQPSGSSVDVRAAWAPLQK